MAGGSALRGLLLALAAGLACACTEVILRDKCLNPPSVVSGRTLSFPVGLSPEIAWAPKDAQLSLLEIAPGVPSTFGKTVPVKWAFVCASNARNELSKLYPKDPIVTSPSWVWCTDGINDAGLSAAILYQSETKKLQRYDKASALKQAINFLDISTYALANFEKLDELKAWLPSIQLVWNNAYNEFGKAMASGSFDHPPLHLTFHDRSGGSLVLQVRDGKTEVLDNSEFSVFTNEPLLQEQHAYTREWLKLMWSNPANDYPSIKAGKAPADNNVFAAGAKTAHPFWPLPGSYSGRDRFARLAMVMNATANSCYSDQSILFKGEREDTNPAYVPQGWPTDNPTLLSVMGVINTVYLPRGIDDAGSAFTAAEWTPMTFLRDHVGPRYYYRTGNNPTYKLVDFQKVNWGALKGAIKTIPYRYSGQPWFNDASNEFA